MNSNTLDAELENIDTHSDANSDAYMELDSNDIDLVVLIKSSLYDCIKLPIDWSMYESHDTLLPRLVKIRRQ